MNAYELRAQRERGWSARAALVAEYAWAIPDDRAIASRRSRSPLPYLRKTSRRCTAGWPTRSIRRPTTSDRA